MMHRRLAVLLCLCAVAACDDPSGPKPPEGVASLEMVSGDRFATAPGAVVPEEARVRVLSPEGAPVAGVQVCFEAKNGATIVNGAEAPTQSCRATDAEGIASVQWRLGPAAGPQTLVAFVTGLPRITFNARATNDPPAQLFLETHSLTLTAIPDARSVPVRATDAAGFAMRVPVTATPHPHADVTATPEGVHIVAREYGGAWVYVAAQANPQLRDSLFVMVEPLAASVTLTGRTDATQGDTAWLRVGLTDALGTPISRPRPLAWTATGGATVRTEVVNGVQYGVVTFSAAGPVTVSVTADNGSASRALQVRGRLSAVRLGLGYDDSCAVDAEGRLFCWGIGMAAASGLQGVPECYSGRPACYPWAVPVYPERRFIDWDTEGYFGSACMLEADGRAYCLAQALERDPVAVTTDLRFTALSMGSRYACALTAAGEAYCWNARTQQNTDPDTVVRAPVGDEVRFTSISAGTTHACGLTTAGTGRCWALPGMTQVPASVLTPGGNAGGMQLRSITAGAQLTCAVDAAGQGYCWGSVAFQNYGQLGRGADTVGGPVASATRFRTVHATERTVCALAEDGSAWCWGSRSKPYRNNTIVLRDDVPTQVPGAVRFGRVVAGDGHACGVDLDGYVHCWFSNPWGTIGNGTFQTYEPAPRAVIRLQ